MAWDISRRVFIRSMGLAAVGVGANPSALMVRAAESARNTGKVLVHVFLRGGADGLSLVVPYGEPEYYEHRGAIALPRPGLPGGVVPLDAHFGLHPALSPLKRSYEAGRLAPVHAVGNYEVSRSHFSAQDFVEMGTPGVGTTTSGTLARMASRLPGRQVSKAIAFSTQRPVSFIGPDPVLVVMDVGRFDLFAANWKSEATQGIKQMYKDTTLGPVAQEIFEAIDVLQGTPQVQAAPANDAQYPKTDLGNSLRQAAQIVKANIGGRCIFVNGTGDFDTHSNQLNANANDYATLGGALAAFDQDLGQKMDDVVVLVTTEFGRTVFMNGSQGTDHGSGYCALVLGGQVKGGRVHGRWPGLKKEALYEERDLAVTTDFRDVFGEIASKHLGVPASAELFPGRPVGSPVGFLA